MNTADQLDIAAKIAEEIEVDIKDRRGLKWEWGKIDDDVKKQIRQRWEELVFTILVDSDV